jgi:N-acetylglucosaminyl-diphospho-decaprenol L-rhamnosyltransferase
MKIHIVIPVHNRREITHRCIECLMAQNDSEFAIIIVDDGSTDGTSEMLAEYGDKLNVIRGDGNLWWTGAVNAGLRIVLGSAADDDAVLLLNDDLHFDEHYLSKIRQAARRNPKALIGSVVVRQKDADMVVMIGGAVMNWWTAQFREPNRDTLLKKYSSGYVFETSALSGQGVLIPVSVFRQIGLYRDDHYMQCGDYELPRRAAKAGYKLIIDYSCVAVTTDNKVNFAKRDVFHLRDISKVFFDIRSYAYWRYRFWFAVDSAENVFQAVSFLVCDFGRLIWRFIIRLRI